jgi:sugar (pentulose or hexulose) kinase
MQNLPFDNTWQYIAEQAAQADDHTPHGKLPLKVDLAFFAGPLGNTGSIRGITTENFTIGRVFRAAFHSMAENYFACAQQLCKSWKGMGLVISGGLTRNMPLLRQMIEELFHLPLRESAVEEETLLGLLDMAREVYPR